MEIRMVLNLPRDAVSVPVSRQVLDSCLATLGVTAQTRGDIALALSEACGNVIQHAGPGDEYEVQIHARNRRCAIGVVNTSTQGSAPDGLAPASEPVPVTAEQGRGLAITDAVAENVELKSSARRGTTVRFEKTLDWVPGAPGQHLFSADA